jgi:hypothetical protein
MTALSTHQWRIVTFAVLAGSVGALLATGPSLLGVFAVASSGVGVAMAAARPYATRPVPCGRCGTRWPLRYDDCGLCVGVCVCPTDAQLDDADRAARHPSTGDRADQETDR